MTNINTEIAVGVSACVKQKLLAGEIGTLENTPDAQGESLPLLISGDLGEPFVVRMRPADVLSIIAGGAWGVAAGGAGCAVAIVLGVVWALTELGVLIETARLITGDHAEVLLYIYQHGQSGTPVTMEAVCADCSCPKADVNRICRDLWRWELIRESTDGFVPEEILFRLKRRTE